MARTIAMGSQDFETIISKHCFYVDKTDFIREWWENMDSVTLLTRPRRFGKTLAINMLERFFSAEYAGQGELFSGLAIWKEKKYQDLQGTYPVISLSFAGVKGNTYSEAIGQIYQIISDLYIRNIFLKDSGLLVKPESEYFDHVCEIKPETNMAVSLHKLCIFMQRYYRKKVIILLDEYDTPMQEAYRGGYWEELVSFTRSLFNFTFKTNPYMERAIMTGITRVSKESVFSDRNNLEVVTTTSEKYADSFGFTQKEVISALSEFGLSNQEAEVRNWYNGFTFGNRTDIYNPWSITNFLDKKIFGTYWANTSSNDLISILIQKGNTNVKRTMEALLKDGVLHTQIDEQIVFDQLGQDESAIWSLLLASGYLKVDKLMLPPEAEDCEYYLKLTNNEVKRMFKTMIKSWFKNPDAHYNDFIKALLIDDKKSMNRYMNEIALTTFSYFDTGKRPSKTLEPERFYHGFVLGLMVDLADRYTITSNRESGFGRYDVMLKPKRDSQKDPAIIIEFKVFDDEEEETLKDTVKIALQQIEKMNYAESLIAEGIPFEHIRKYGFAFQGKKVLIG